MFNDVVNFIGGLIPMGCSSPSEVGVRRGAGHDAGEDAQPLAEAGVDGGSDASDDVSPGVPDAVADCCAEATADAAEDAVPDAVDDADASEPKTPPAPDASVYSEAPCAFPASLVYSSADDRLSMSCGGAPGALWKSPPMGAAGAWSPVANVGGAYPANHAMIDDRYAVVAHSVPDGFTIIDMQTNAVTQQVNFADLTIFDASNNPLAFTPNFPAGIVAAGGKLFIATNNIDEADYAHPENTSFHPGTLLSFDDNGDGTVDAGSAKAHITSCLNPTAATKIDDSTIAVLSSGSYDPATTEAELEICELPELDCTATQLGNLTAQTSPVMPITASGLILVGIQKPANRIMGVDVASHAIALDREMPGVANFIASIAAFGDVAALGDFGAFGAGSRILFAHTDPAGWSGEPETPLAWGSAGPAVIVGDALYVAATSNDGTGGRVYRVSLSGME